MLNHETLTLTLTEKAPDYGQGPRFTTGAACSTLPAAMTTSDGSEALSSQRKRVFVVGATGYIGKHVGHRAAT